MDLTQWDAKQIWAALTTLVTVAAAIAAMTPSPKDDSIVAKLRGLLDVIAFNFWNARNEK